MRGFVSIVGKGVAGEGTYNQISFWDLRTGKHKRVIEALVTFNELKFVTLEGSLFV